MAENPLESASDHIVWEYLKAQDAAAWRLVWDKVVLPESRSLCNSSKMHDWNISAEELYDILYLEMIGKEKINNYRDDGGSLWGWLRKYVQGYISREKPDERLVPLESGESSDEEDRFENTISEKKLNSLSDTCSSSTLLGEDPALKQRERWAMVQRCFAELYHRSPMRAYVHLLRLRRDLSSVEIMNMLGITSVANVDQTFSRATRDMRELREKYDRD